MPEDPRPIVPLYGRYPSKEMKELFPKDNNDFRYYGATSDMKKIFSDETKYLGWRRIWVVLAEQEKKLGLPFSEEQIAAIRQKEKVIDYARAAELEKKTKHDVMSYLTEYKEQVDPVLPGAGGILHAGATSCSITDNEELAAMRKGMIEIRRKVDALKRSLGMPDVGITEYISNLEFALKELDYRIASLKARGIKGTTGTQASYLELFDGDHEKVKSLDQKVSQALGFKDSYTITGQTYPRIVDYQVLSSLGLVAEVLKTLAPKIKFHDSNLSKKLEHVQDCARNAAQMASMQWLERTLDDSSERRIIIPEAFYALDYAIKALLMDRVGENQQEIGEEQKIIPENTDEAKGLEIITKKLANAIDKIHKVAKEHKDTVCTAYTHYQFAQPTTYGKRADLWAYNFVLALKDSENMMQATAPKAILIYPNAINYLLNSRLNQACIAAAKMSNDIRLLQHDLEINEPFGISQVGSSAMPYKKNPMRSERTNGLARTKIGLIDAIKEPNYSFLATDAVMELVLTNFGTDTEKQKGFTIHEKAAKANLMRFMPFLATENLLMDAVKKGGDRQELHEVVRTAMLEARENIDNGKENNILEILAKTGKFDIDLSKKEELLDPTKYVGRCREQVEEFGEKEVKPIREKYAAALGIEGAVKI